MNTTAIRKAFLSVGLYRQARTIYRHLSKSEMDEYKTDRKFYSKLLPKSGALCFDVGANLGRVTEALLELGHKVIAFEPQPQCIREIKARCRPFRQHLQIEETALGDSQGATTLFVRESSGQSSLRSTWEGTAAGVLQVPVSTLDVAIQRFGIPYYCKIDVEGWEPHVLQGLSQPIPLLSFEYHQNHGLMQDAYACLDHLSSLARIQVNITPSEKSRLVLDTWLDVDEFKAAFQTKFQGREQFLFGDLYVKML